MQRRLRPFDERLAENVQVEVDDERGDKAESRLQMDRHRRSQVFLIWADTGPFFFYFRPFIFKFQYYNLKKTVDGVLGIRTRAVGCKAQTKNPF